jgi:hypothetical protein
MSGNAIVVDCKRACCNAPLSEGFLPAAVAHADGRDTEVVAGRILLRFGDAASGKKKTAAALPVLKQL